MNNIKLVKHFCEENYELFQEWLEDVHEIEGTEAEIILDSLED